MNRISIHTYLINQPHPKLTTEIIYIHVLPLLRRGTQGEALKRFIRLIPLKVIVSLSYDVTFPLRGKRMLIMVEVLIIRKGFFSIY
jgi:hypothetical protein